MSVIFKKITRFTNSSKNLIVIELRIDKSDLIRAFPLRSDSFLVTDKESCYLELNLLKQDRFFLKVCNFKHQNQLIKSTVLIFEEDQYSLQCFAYPGNAFESSSRIDLLQGFLKSSASIKYPMIITCYLETKNYNESNRTEVTDSNLLERLQELSDDLTKILDQGCDYDVTLNMNGVEMKAHKIILRARSQVFDKMFEYDTSEAKEKKIGIIDIRAPIMKELLTYLYTGKKKYFNFEDASELYYAADKYGVLSLREACKKDLLSHLRVENACQMLCFVNQHGDEDFKKEIMKFIKNNFGMVVETEAFEELALNHPKMALSITRFHMRPNKK